jgi:hypothetical protein
VTKTPSLFGAALALAMLVVRAPVGAQQGPEPLPGAERAAGPRPAPGTAIRLVVTDPAALPPGVADRSTPNVGEGRLVRFESTSVVVRLRSGQQFAYPASVVRRLEVRGDPLPRAALWTRRALALAAGVAGGWLVGRAIGSYPAGGVATDPADESELAQDLRREAAEDARQNRREWTRRGVVFGTTLGTAAAFITGRHPWAPYPGWPPGE